MKPIATESNPAIEKLHKHFVDSRVKGFVWKVGNQQITHHPMSRAEAEALWEEAKDNIIAAVFSPGSGSKPSSGETSTFAELEIGSLFEFAGHQPGWLDIAKGPWIKVSPRKYAKALGGGRGGVTGPMHTVGLASVEVVER